MEENNVNVVENQESKFKKFVKKVEKGAVKFIRIATPIATALNSLFLVSCCVSAAKDCKTDLSKSNSNESLEVKPVNQTESSVG